MALLILGIIVNQDDMIGAGFVLLLVTIVFGWILFGNIVPQETLQETITARVLHDERAVHLSYSNKVVYTYTDVGNLNYLRDKTEIKVVHTTNKNLYGRVIETHWELSNER